MSTLAQNTPTLTRLKKLGVGQKTQPGVSNQGQGEAPVGYRWVSRRWRVLPDGTRDYAAYHGKTSFSVLLPVSSKLKSPRR